MSPPGSPRDRRLRADREALAALAATSTILTVESSGERPERYCLAFAGASVVPGPRGPAVTRGPHRLEVRLPPEYPRVAPELRVVTPLFHPNVAEGGRVCLGGYSTRWAPGLRLDAMAEMVWDMLRFANLDVQSPLNRVAAQWASAPDHPAFPVDLRPLRDRLAAARAPAPMPPAMRFVDRP